MYWGQIGYNVCIKYDRLRNCKEELWLNNNPQLECRCSNSTPIGTETRDCPYTCGEGDWKGLCVKIDKDGENYDRMSVFESKYQ